MTAPVRFTVVATADAQVLPRLLEWFAQRGLIPAEVRACVTGGTLRVVIEQEGLSDLQAGIIGDKMRSSVMVERVDLARGGVPVRPWSA